MRGLGLVAAAGVIVAGALVAARDPEEAWAVAVVIVALAVAAGALATLILLRAPRAGRERRGTAVRRGVAARRGVEVAIAVALLLWLRVVDGLSPVTAGFVVGGFVIAEAVLAARTESSR